MLQIVKSSEWRRPFRICLYGPEGCGKTTFAAGFDRPLFIPCEEGVSRLGITVDCLPVPTHLSDVERYITEFPVDQYRTIVIDTIDALEALIHRTILEESKASSLELAYGGFGKGYNIATEKMAAILEKLDVLRNKGIQVVLLGHTVAKTFNNPTGPDYMRYELSLHKGSAVQGCGPRVKAWVDVLAFANFNDMVKVHTEDSGDPLAKGKAITGRRMIYTVHCAAFDAKSPGLPPAMELDSKIFLSEIAKLAAAHSNPPAAATVGVSIAPVRTAAPTANTPKAEEKPTVLEVLKEIITTPTVITTVGDVKLLGNGLTLKHVQDGLMKFVNLTKQDPQVVASKFVKNHGVQFSKELPKEKWPVVLIALIQELEKQKIQIKIPV